MTPRREMSAVLAATAAGAALVLVAAGQTWARVTWQRHPTLPPAVVEVTGGDAAPLAPAAGLVLLAAGGALLAVRGAGRLLVGALMVVAGAGTAWAAGRALGDADVFTAQLDALGVPAADWTRDLAPVWPVLAVAGGVLGVLAGLVTAARGRRWPAMGRRYERPGPAGSAAPPASDAGDDQRGRAAWAALDRGEDPTVDPPAAGSSADPAPGPPDRGR